MPDPALYLVALATSAVVSALAVRWIVGLRRPTSALRLNTACAVGVGVGIVIGGYVLQLPISWPPMNGLDRLWTIVLPAVLVIEWVSGVLIGALERGEHRLAWFLRLGLAAAVGRVLLHGSVYLSGPSREWSVVQAAATLATCGALVAAEWALLTWLLRRSPGVSIPLALAASIQGAGIAIMLAGYLSGGAASVPLAAALVGATVAAHCLMPCPDLRAILGVGVVGLSGLAIIGLFFGRLSTASALAVSLAPLLCWATELSAIRSRGPWVVGSLRFVLVAIPLAVVLGLGVLDFVRHTAPLLTSSPAPCGHGRSNSYSLCGLASTHHGSYASAASFHLVEVTETPTLAARGQIDQVFDQIDATLATLGADRTRLLRVLVYLSDLADAPALNDLWDSWAPTGHAPVRTRAGSIVGWLQGRDGRDRGSTE